MYIIISIFYASLFLMLVMIILKRREVKTGRKSLISRMGSGMDNTFRTMYHALRRNISYINRKTFIVIGQWIAYHVLFQIRKIYVEMKHRALLNPHSRKVINAVRGRGDVKRHGASFYLRRINEVKD